MAAPGNAPIALALNLPKGSSAASTDALLTAMLRAHDQVSDLIFSPGRPPQVEVLGRLLAVDAPGLQQLTADDTRRIASDLIGSNKQAITLLREQGSCDVSYGLAGVARFRVNAFIQRGSCAVVIRVIPAAVPDLASLGLPPQLAAIADLRDGMVLVTGSRGSGKSSTLAALLDRINQRRTCHIITIEDPIEFLHNHKHATIHQRELHSDAPGFVPAMRAALRQAPRVILVSELRERETMEMALEAAETGHLVLSSMNSVDAAQIVERIVGAFPSADQSSIRSRLAKSFRYIVAQKLIPRHDTAGRTVAVEILKDNPRAAECLERNDRAGLLAVMKDCAAEGMQHFDGEIEKLVRSGIIDLETALAYAAYPQELRQVLLP